MSYQSPLKHFQTDPFIEAIKDETDNMVFRAVVHANVNVDREELIKALEYDRGQYEKGYADGLAYKPPVITQADRIRGMTDEELAEWLYDWAGGAPNCDRELGEKPDNKTCRDCWMAWIKSPVEEGEG